MVVVAMKAVLMILDVVIKVLAWDAVTGDMVVVLVLDVLTGEGIIVSAIVLKFALPVSYSVDVPSGVVVGFFMDALADVMIIILSGIGIEVLSDVNANALAVVMAALEFPASTPSKRFCR